jgi:uncharacterized protein YggE
MTLPGFVEIIAQMRPWAVALGVGLAPLGAATAFAADTAAAAQVIVSGEGSVTVTPDLVQVRSGVSNRAATVREAADANSRTMKAVIDKLVEAGVERKDIQTAQFSIQPVYASPEPRGEQKLVGYSVSNQVIAKIRNVDKVSDILDRLISAGATNVWNMEFLVSDPSKALDQARRAAVADARRKAEIYASEAGVKLGPVVAITEEGELAPPMPFMRQAAAPRASAAPPIASGEDTLRTHVTVGFALAP